MRTRRFFHGTNGDNILSILESGKIHPSTGGEIYFAEHEWAGVLRHGVDKPRGRVFVIAVEVTYDPDTAREERIARPGAPRDTFRLLTKTPVNARVIELHARRPTEEGFEFTHVVGKEAILEALEV